MTIQVKRDRMSLIEGDFSYKTIVEAFYTVTFGYEEPNILRCSPTVRDRLNVLFAVPGGASVANDNRLMGADIIVSGWMPDDEIWLENSARPKGTDYYNRFNAKVKFTQ